jgi:hypothetical protein
MNEVAHHETPSVGYQSRLQRNTACRQEASGWRKLKSKKESAD